MIVLLTVFVGLGLWQLERAREKTEIRNNFVARADQPTVVVGAEPLDLEAMVFRNASAAGHFVAEFQVLLDNKVYQGRSGFHVLTPLRLRDNDMLLLVDRGWMPWGADRQQVPAIDVPTGDVDVNGRLAWPTRYAISFESDVHGFQPVWQDLDLARYARVTGQPVHGLILQIAPDSPSQGFVRDWPQYQDSWVQRHRGYAVQWFALAATLLLIFVGLNLRRRSS